ncbi:universal stress protein [Mycobacterium sp. PDNC021]|uniref:universal stress protein n=1 Tax=Mycobacterium sp. PDNC021 TaxID=3391399 RepID=UPI003AAD1413
MTIIAGFSASRHGSAPINLAVQIAKTTGEKVIAAAVLERSWPPRNDPVEDEYLRHVKAQTAQSLQAVVDGLPGRPDVPTLVHESGSIPTGLLELAQEFQARAVVLGSSSSGLLGRVALGSVTERLVHTAQVPVAIAPRGYAFNTGPIRRVTAAYGGEADTNGLIRAAAELAKDWGTPLRVVAYTVRPVWAFGGASGAEDMVVAQWSKRTVDDVTKQLNKIREQLAVPDVDMIVSSGRDWQQAVENTGWSSGDVLLLGSGAAGQSARVFLGSAAAKILRHSPVPVMIMPRA